VQWTENTKNKEEVFFLFKLGQLGLHAQPRSFMAELTREMATMYAASRM
jgi:hypothetical protein